MNNHDFTQKKILQAIHYLKNNKGIKPDFLNHQGNWEVKNEKQVWFANWHRNLTFRTFSLIKLNLITKHS